MNVPILLYHSVSRTPSAWIDQFTVTPQTFSRHLHLIKAAGLHAVTVTALRTALAQRELPAKPIVITFDDGFADTLEAAAPMLSAYDMPATVYVTSGFVGGRSPGGDRMLSWSGVTELAGLGHEIGAHSVNHPELDTLSPSVVWYEVTHCRVAIEQQLGQPIHTFAYPHGYSSPAVRRFVANAGYRSACSVKNALSPYDDPPFTISRLTVTRDMTDETLTNWLTGQARVARPHDLLSTKLWRLYRRTRGRLR